MVFWFVWVCTGCTANFFKARHVNAKGLSNRAKKLLLSLRTFLLRTPYPIGEKHTISTFVDQAHIQRTRPRRKKFFSKLVLQ